MIAKIVKFVCACIIGLTVAIFCVMLMIQFNAIQYLPRWLIRTIQLLCAVGIAADGVFVWKYVQSLTEADSIELPGVVAEEIELKKYVQPKSEPGSAEQPPAQQTGETVAVPVQRPKPEESLYWHDLEKEGQ
jgi:flagellar biosynthesis protein FliQ